MKRLSPPGPPARAYWLECRGLLRHVAAFTLRPPFRLCVDFPSPSFAVRAARSMGMVGPWLITSDLHQLRTTICRRIVLLIRKCSNHADRPRLFRLFLRWIAPLEAASAASPDITRSLTLLSLHRRLQRGPLIVSPAFGHRYMLPKEMPARLPCFTRGAASSRHYRTNPHTTSSAFRRVSVPRVTPTH